MKLLRLFGRQIDVDVAAKGTMWDITAVQAVPSVAEEDKGRILKIAFHYRLYFAFLSLKTFARPTYHFVLWKLMFTYYSKEPSQPKVTNITDKALN